MPTDYRVQVVGQVNPTDPGRDFVTNVLWYNSNTTAANAIGDAVLAAYLGNGSLGYTNWSSIQVKVYDHAAPLHSPPVYATTPHTGSGMGALLGPRQVALCLSFYSGLNVRGQRGRIYLGPWTYSLLKEYPDSTVLGNCLTMGVALKNPGGADVVHRIHHKKTDTFSNVSNYFVNNRWDTMRSRLPHETSRVHSP